MIPLLVITNSRRKATSYIRTVLKRAEINPNMIFTYEPDKSIITIDQIREIATLFARADPLKKAIIIYEFNSAKETTQNALLKTLEEKSERAQFIIVVRSELSVLPTIISRCQIIKIKNDAILATEMHLDQPLAELIIRYQFVEKDAKKAITVCDELLIYFRNKLRNNEEDIQVQLDRSNALSQTIKEIINVRKAIDQNNLGPQIAIDHLLVFIHSRKKYLFA